MTRHLFKIIWNRKRHNFLLAVEIFFSFLVLLAVVVLVVLYTDNWRRPLGYDIDRVWIVGIDRKEPDGDPAVKARHRETLRQLLAAAKDLPQIETVAVGLVSPYSSSNWLSGYNLADGRSVQFGANSVIDDYREPLRLNVIRGRWFSHEDDGVTWVPLVVNERFAREVFGDADPISKTLPIRQEPNRPAMRERRVIGVIDDFRKDGELSTPGNFVFTRARLEGGPPNGDVPGEMILRVAPGTTAAFEETLLARLQGVAREWSFEVRPLSDLREEMLREYTGPLIGFGTVAGFLLLMVAFGLTGVVWQSVTQRTREFGLRRAKGATIPNVRRQVIGELLIMTTLALIAALLLVLQIPMLPDKAVSDILVGRGVFVTSVALSIATIYLLTLACAWYPSRLATRIQPAEALHYE